MGYITWNHVGCTSVREQRTPRVAPFRAMANCGQCMPACTLPAGLLFCYFPQEHAATYGTSYKRASPRRTDARRGSVHARKGRGRTPKSRPNMHCQGVRYENSMVESQDEQRNNQKTLYPTPLHLTQSFININRLIAPPSSVPIPLYVHNAGVRVFSPRASSPCHSTSVRVWGGVLAARICTSGKQQQISAQYPCCDHHGRRAWPFAVGALFPSRILPCQRRLNSIDQPPNPPTSSACMPPGLVLQCSI